jgi:DNA gyrase subunit A
MAQDLTRKGGRLVAAFPVEQGDELLLVTDQGKLIRVPVGAIRIAARNTQGVIVFRTNEDEHVVSVERLAESESDNGENGAEDENGDADGEAGPAEGEA